MKYHWAFPGGGVEAGESLAHAAQREVEEECGITVDVIEPFYVTEIYSPPPTSPTPPSSTSPSLQYVLVHFLGRLRDPCHYSQVKAGDDAMSVRWVDLEEVHAWRKAMPEAYNPTLAEQQRRVGDEDSPLVVPEVLTVLDRATLLWKELSKR